MRTRTVLITLLILMAPAYAQKSKSVLQSEITSSFPDQNIGAITPSIMRGVFSDFVNSWQQYISVNSQTGTSYAVLASDYAQIINLSHSGSVAVTIPQPTGVFLTFNTYIYNSGSGTVTVTPTGSTINGGATLTIASGTNFWIMSDGTGTNYTAFSANVTFPIALANGGLGGSQAAATVNQVPVFPGSLGAAVPTTITPSIIGSLGTGVATALGINTGSAGAFAVLGGTFDTPSSMTATNVVGLPAAGVIGTAATLTVADQTLSGGANITPANLGTKSSGTTTIDCGTVPLQYLTNGGAFTLAAPSNDGSCMVQIINNGSAGSISFSGFTVGANVGDSLDTTNTHKFMISIARINGSSVYNIQAQQ